MEHITIRGRIAVKSEEDFLSTFVLLGQRIKLLKEIAEKIGSLKNIHDLKNKRFWPFKGNQLKKFLEKKICDRLN